MHGFNGSVHSGWYSTPTSLHNSSMRLNGRGFVSRSARFRSVGIFTTSSRPSSLAACSQRRLVCTCFANPSPWWSHAIVTRVLFPKSLSPLWRPRASTPVDTAAYSSLSHDDSDTAFCLLDQNLKSPPLWTSTLHSLNACLHSLLPNHCPCMP